MNTSEIISQNFKDLFAEYARRKGKQTDLAADAGVNQGQISDWSRSGLMPKPQAWDGLARAFGLETVDLLSPGAVQRARAFLSDGSIARAEALAAQRPSDELAELHRKLELLRGHPKQIRHIAGLLEDAVAAVGAKSGDGDVGAGAGAG